MDFFFLITLESRFLLFYFVLSVDSTDDEQILVHVTYLTYFSNYSMLYIIIIYQLHGQKFRQKYLQKSKSVWYYNFVKF